MGTMSSIGLGSHRQPSSKSHPAPSRNIPCTPRNNMINQKASERSSRYQHVHRQMQHYCHVMRNHVNIWAQAALHYTKYLAGADMPVSCIAVKHLGKGQSHGKSLTLTYTPSFGGCCSSRSSILTTLYSKDRLSMGMLFRLAVVCKQQYLCQTYACRSVASMSQPGSAYIGGRAYCVVLEQAQH